VLLSISRSILTSGVVYSCSLPRSLRLWGYRSKGKVSFAPALLSSCLHLNAWPVKLQLVNQLLCFFCLGVQNKEKVNNLVLFDKATYDKLLAEVPKYKMITQVSVPACVSRRAQRNGALLQRLGTKASCSRFADLFSRWTLLLVRSPSCPTVCASAAAWHVQPSGSWPPRGSSSQWSSTHSSSSTPAPLVHRCSSLATICHCISRQSSKAITINAGYVS
jgi:hypothetical protein